MAEANETSPKPLPLGGRIYMVRGRAVMLDSDLAEVYEVETGALNRAVQRNASRFLEEFAFQLQQNEWDALRCQIGISNTGRGGRRYLPWVFTEHGAVMLATVLNSDRAVKASIAVVNAFVRLRHVVDANFTFARRLEELSARVDRHDRALVSVFEELKRLALGTASEDAKPKERIGFKTNRERGVSGRKK